MIMISQLEPSLKDAEMCFLKTCDNIGRCYGNQGLAEAVENNFWFEN